MLSVNSTASSPVIEEIEEKKLNEMVESDNYYSPITHEEKSVRAIFTTGHSVKTSRKIARRRKDSLTMKQY